MNEANRLLPCPFCMGDAERIELDDAFNEGGSCITCKKCGASSPVHFNFKENLDESWNTRAGQPPAQDEANAVITELVEALEAAIAYIGGNSVVGNQFLDLLEATQSRARAYTGKAG